MEPADRPAEDATMGISPLTWALLAGLLALSALVSAWETALFSLTPPERRRAGPAALRLLENPRSLLVTMLLANLVVNLLFFAFAAGIDPLGGPLGELFSGLSALFVVVLLGEVLPKTLALRARVAVARSAAVPVALLVALARPVQRTAEGVIELFYRVLGEVARAERGVTAEALAGVLEHSAQQGLLLESEAEFLAGLVELSALRVREIMTPRVDMLFLEVQGEGRAELVARAVEARATWLVLIDGNPDQVLGRARVRDLLLRPQAPLRELLQPVPFVPEVASVLHALEFLRRQGLAMAVVVDEWGGTAGQVRLEDVFEEIVGDLRVEGERPERAVVALGDGRFRVVGSLSIRDWNEQFGHRVVPTEFETVGGFVTALLGRIPRSGDEVRSGGLVFKVDQVHRRRIRTLEISVVEPDAEESVLSR